MLARKCNVLPKVKKKESNLARSVRRQIKMLSVRCHGHLLYVGQPVKMKGIASMSSNYRTVNSMFENLEQINQPWGIVSRKKQNMWFAKFLKAMSMQFPTHNEQSTSGKWIVHQRKLEARDQWKMTKNHDTWAVVSTVLETGSLVGVSRNQSCPRKRPLWLNYFKDTPKILLLHTPTSFTANIDDRENRQWVKVCLNLNTFSQKVEDLFLNVAFLSSKRNWNFNLTNGLTKERYLLLVGIHDNGHPTEVEQFPLEAHPMHRNGSSYQPGSSFDDIQNAIVSLA